MKGFTPEVLIVCGTYLVSDHPILSGTMLALGCLSSFIRYSINFTRDQKREKFIDAGYEALTSIIEAANKAEAASFWTNTKNSNAAVH
jgi:hypothetical protein